MSQSLLAAGLLRRLADVPVAYLLLWCLLVAVSLTLVALSRTGWARNRPLHKCAMLSLLVHLVFACVAMTVRVVVGDGSGKGSGPPIRVRIIDDMPGPTALAPISAETVADMAPPALFDPPTPEPSASPVGEESSDSKVAADDTPESIEPEEIVDLPVDAVVAVPPADMVAAQAVETSADVPTEIGPLPTNPSDMVEPPSPRNDVRNSQPKVVEAEVAPVGQTATETIAATEPTAAYALRSAPGRLGWVETQGGNVRTEAAVAAALKWLATAQSPDGHWDADRFGAGRELNVMGQDRQGAGRDADTGVSALALLAFLGAGHTHRQGEHQVAVRRGLDYLIRAQAADGSLFGSAEMYAQMYCHSMATFALAEAAAMTRDEQLEPAVSRAIAFSLRAQNSSTGGWRYRPGDTGDTSQLGWQMMALSSARRAGLTVPPQTWAGIGRFLRSVRRGNHGGLASYRPDSPASTSMTAEALYCRLLMSETLGSPLDELANGEATAQLLATLPDPDRVNLYYWYYATLALHHRQQSGDQAAAAWHAWNDALTSVLLGKQLTTGPDAGSWNTDCLWGGYGGRVYTTAMAAMCLEVYYRYAPNSPRDAWIATRPREHD